MTSDERATRSTAARPSGRALAALAGAFVASLPGPALAEEAPAASALDDFIVWQAPVGCSTAAAIRERLRELVGQAEIERERVSRVVGKVSETRSGWELNLTLVDALGTRERRLESSHCADLAEAAAVAISLAFEAARAREREELEAASLEPTPSAEASAASAPPARAPEPDAPAPAPNEAEPRDRSAFTPWLGAELWLDAHALPSAAAGVSVIGALRGAGLRLGAFAAWLPGVERSVAPGQGVRFSLLLAGVRGCVVLGRGVVDTALCAGFEAGRLSARGPSLLAARSANDLWLAPELGLELGTELGSHLALHLRGGAFAPLLRQGYTVNETDDVHQVASVGVRASFGVLYGF